jgi:hypothetical protein
MEDGEKENEYTKSRALNFKVCNKMWIALKGWLHKKVIT